MGILMCLKSGVYFLLFSVLLTFSLKYINVFECTAPSSNSINLMFIQLRSSNEDKIEMLSDQKLKSSSGVSSRKPNSRSGNGLTSLNKLREDHGPPEIPRRTGPPPLPPRDPSIFQTSRDLEKRVEEQLTVLDSILKEIEDDFGCVGIDSSGQNELPENDDVFD
ncbi:hypothetical protein CmeUKMEL1_07890 [Cryptosporidium meleagridis]|uniref:Uncharacterized protein n=1 Tax=Cryptosporidium meleagridis TaxID=93969 RepID=A0A2P4Z0E6_9CRYT|nr:hypothetical protein CmeUKMEL1_07890 [Cryptosporidium meleagridis]